MRHSNHATGWRWALVALIAAVTVTVTADIRSSVKDRAAVAVAASGGSSFATVDPLRFSDSRRCTRATWLGRTCRR